ncbi:MAG: AAA family ATPase [Anaerolineales bacterium]|nr:AAA family ATPase [Anaerolineales bacterium]
MNLSNPYIAGNPVGGTPNFIGRADILREVVRVLRHPAQNAIVLFGQRRIGKTSVLQQLTEQLPKEGPFHSVYFDLQDKAAWPLARVLTEIARTIADALHLPAPDLGSDPAWAFHKEWLPAVLKDLSVSEQNPSSLVLLFDEFDVLADPKGGQAGAELFPYLRQLMALDPTRLQFVFVIGRKVEDLESIALSLFKGTQALRVSLLDHDDTLQLARLSEQNESLHWAPDALEKVWELTHGHPFLTQQLCSRVWENLYDDDPSNAPAVMPEDVEQAIPKTLEASRNTMEWIWGGLPPAERVVISALAKMGNEPITQEQLEQMLRESGVRVVIRELQNAPQLLQDWDLLEPVDGGFQFKVELLRRWLLKYKPLNRVQEELDRLIPLAENLYQAAMAYYRAGQADMAENQVRQAVASNPNHARANELLADILISKGEIDDAIKVLRALFENQPVNARPRLVEALFKKIEREKDEIEHINLYRQILAVDSRHPRASKQVAEYERAQRQQEMALELAKLQTLENEKRYREALELVKELAGKYNEERDWQPEVERIAQKVNLAEIYQQAIEALHKGNKEAAIQEFVHVLTVEPRYEEATRFLHQAINGEDIPAFKLQIQNLQKEINDLRELKTFKQLTILKLQNVNLRNSCQQADRQIEKLQNEKQSLQSTNKELKLKIQILEAENERQKKNVRSGPPAVSPKDLPASASRPAPPAVPLRAENQTLQPNTKSPSSSPQTVANKVSSSPLTPLPAPSLRPENQTSQPNTKKPSSSEPIPTPNKSSSSNPFDYLRILFWVFFARHHLEKYQKVYGEDSLQSVGNRLAFSLIWLPLVLPTLALGLETLPSSDIAWLPAIYLWISGGISLVWLLSVWLAAWLNETNQASGVAIIVTFSIAGGIAGSIASSMTFSIAFGVAFGMIFGVAVRIASILASNLVQKVAGGVILPILVIILTGKVAGVVAVVMAFIVATYMDDESKWIKAGIFTLGLLAYGFLLWFCYFGGWRVFSG